MVDYLTFSDINLVRQVLISGIRITQLAQGVMISKQAAAKSIASLNSVPDFREARGGGALLDNSAEFSSDGVYQRLDSIGGEE
jgi:hypothetical protein